MNLEGKYNPSSVTLRNVWDAWALKNESIWVRLTSDRPFNYTKWHWNPPRNIIVEYKPHPTHRGRLQQSPLTPSTKPPPSLFHLKTNAMCDWPQAGLKIWRVLRKCSACTTIWIIERILLAEIMPNIKTVKCQIINYFQIYHLQRGLKVNILRNLRTEQLPPTTCHLTTYPPTHLPLPAGLHAQTLRQGCVVQCWLGQKLGSLYSRLGLPTIPCNTSPCNTSPCNATPCPPPHHAMLTTRHPSKSTTSARAHISVCSPTLTHLPFVKAHQE